jgi:transposase
MQSSAQSAVAVRLEDYEEGFLAELARLGYACRTREAQRYLLRHLSRWLAGRDLELSELSEEVAGQYCANYLPVARAARLVAALTGVNVSAGFVAGVRGKAARLLAPFMNRVRELLPAAPVLYADETPARAAGKLHYVHVACTEFLTAMHTGDRTGEAIDAGGVLPGYA